ncbi:MAG: hypothetical protein ACKESB_00535 [Candidatus Hodgkinia cicadicola]
MSGEGEGWKMSATVGRRLCGWRNARSEVWEVEIRISRKDDLRYETVVREANGAAV